MFCDVTLRKKKNKKKKQQQQKKTTTKTHHPRSMYNLKPKCHRQTVKPQDTIQFSHNIPGTLESIR